MKLQRDRILFEDNHIIAINKHAGELSQSDDTGDTSLEDTVRVYIKEKYNKPGNVFLQAVHRLDRPVSGVMLFARTSKAVERMTGLLREREVKKIYWAVVKQKPPKLHDELIHYLKRIETKNITKAIHAPTSDAKESKLTYRILKSADKYFQIEIMLETGRHHQIRVQLSEIGCPIVGDVKYGYAAPLPDASTALHARKIEFIHPIKKEPIVIEATPPRSPIWKRFDSR